MVLKHLPTQIIEKYTILFNNIINNGYYPSQWKQAKIIPIQKPDKDPEDATSYRPISLLPNISKVFEVIINQHILKHCGGNKLIPDQQFGFRKQLSTSHAIHKFTSDVAKDLHNCKAVGACLVDLEKAFDSAWIKGLLYKLYKKDFPKPLIMIIWNMLKDRDIKVAGSNQTLSRPSKLKEGLQQGTVNAPTLFNIYSAETLNLFDLNSNNSNSKALAYADDLIVYTSCKSITKTKIEQEDKLNKINNYYKTWKLKINPKKCESILFRKPTRFLSKEKKESYKEFRLEIKEEGTNEREQIPHNKLVKYLGVHIDELFRISQHIDIQLEKAKKAFHKNIRIFLSKWISSKAKIICYMLLIRPIITYAAPIWFNTNAASMEKYRRFERQILRHCLYLNRSEESNYKKLISNKIIYNKAMIPRIDTFIIKLIIDYHASLKKIDNNKSLTDIQISNNDAQKYILSGYTPPEIFTFLDNKGYIQDAQGIPSIYHWPRHKKDKKILFDPEWTPTDNPEKFKYSTSIPNIDIRDTSRLNEGYWWLTNDAKHIEEIRARSRRRNQQRIQVAHQL